MLLSVAAFTLISIALASASHPGITKCDVGSSIPWQSCSIFRYNDTLDAVKPQCGYFTVPADYKNCSAGTVRLAVARRPANVKPRLGTLFVNPGSFCSPVNSIRTRPNPSASHVQVGQEFQGRVSSSMKNRHLAVSPVRPNVRKT